MGPELRARRRELNNFLTFNISFSNGFGQACMVQNADEAFEVVDSSHLTDADWAEINKLNATWRNGGKDALSKALGALADADPIRYTNVTAALFPDLVREAIKAMAERGITEEDVRDLIRNLESPAGKQ